MQNIKKYFMTLALLLTAVGGAWADETPLLTIEGIDNEDFTSGSKTFDDKVTVTFSNPVYNDGDEDGWYSAGGASLLTVAGTNGYTITSCKFYTSEGIAATGYTIVGESPSVYLSQGHLYTDANQSVNLGTYGVKKIEVYGGAASSATDPNAVTASEINSDLYSGWSSIDEKLLKASDLPGFQAVTENQAKSWTGVPSTGRVKLFYDFVADGNVKVVIFNNGVYDSSYEEEELTCYLIYEDIKYNGDTKYFYTTGPAPTEWSLTPDETGKTWTLAEMPASNVELQVEYYAESNLFLGKEALADKTNISVLNGETAVEFGDDGKSANTVTEGTPMTVKFNGTKKVLGMKVEKKATVDPAKAYLKWDADQKKLVATEMPAEVTKVENSDSYVEWSGTYVVEGNVTISGNITLSGNVNLIIKDGAKLTAKKIIGYNNNLSIYGQANQTGQLVVDNPGDDAITSMKTLEVHSAKVTATSSYNDRGGIGFTGTINVYGGSVDATAANGYGIWLGGNGSMNIYGGEVKAVGKGNGGYSYGIAAGTSATVTVNGGKLWAENADKKAIYTSNITLTKGTGFTGKIEYSSDNSTWSETVDADAKYVRAGY